MNWYKIIKISQKQQPIAWIDKDGNTIPYIHDDHYVSLIKHYNLSPYDRDKAYRELTDKYKLIRVCIDFGVANFSLNFEGITSAQKGKMLDILVDNNIFHGYIDTFKGSVQFNSFKEFKRMIQTL